MSYKLKLELPTSDRGTEVAVYGLGLVANGVPLYISNEEADLFEALNGRSLKEAFGDALQEVTDETDDDEGGE